MSETTDGRLLRGARSREAVAAAVLALLEDGVARPTRQAIADRAGVSLRLVHHHFREREQLFAAAARLQNARVSRGIRPLPTDRPLPERLRAFVNQRAEVLEAITPVRRAAQAEEPFSEFLTGTLGAWRRLKRDQALAVFAPELGRLRGAARRDIEAAVCAAASWSTWEELRRYQGLDVPAARAVMRRTLRALLEAKGTRR